MNVVIITGASSGLGREFFKSAFELCPNAHEFWLVARRKEALKATAALCKNSICRIISTDLSQPEGLAVYENLLTTEQPNVLMLINNAGFGKLGEVSKLSPETQRDMVGLNCGALCAITAMTLKYMEKGSAIINVASIAAFNPNQNMTVYSATKAFVFSFSKSLRRELKPSGINVLALCPGPMDTEFLSVAEISGNSKTFDMLPRVNPKQAAKTAIIKAKKGKAVYTPRGVYKLYRVITKLLPHNLTMKMGRC